MALDLASILGGSVGDTAAKIIGMFKLSPDKKAELEAQLQEHDFELQKLQAEMQQRLLDAQENEINVAGQNIRSETSSDDKFTSRARPSFMYLIIAVLGLNYGVIPFLQKWHFQPVVLPDALIWLFGSSVLGYTGARTWEKFMALPGESKVELPFGLKASNKQ